MLNSNLLIQFNFMIQLFKAYSADVRFGTRCSVKATRVMHCKYHYTGIQQGRVFIEMKI